MALHDEILREIQNGSIPKEFKLADLKKKPVADNFYQVGGDVFSHNTINTMPANLAIDLKSNTGGNHVNNGAKAQYIRVRKGIYRLIGAEELLIASAIHEDEVIEIDDDKVEPLKTQVATTLNVKAVAEYVADYLHLVPYQRLFKKQNRTHPLKPANGLTERLHAYFWPDMSVNWASTQKELNHFVTEFRDIELNKNSDQCAARLMRLFEQICKWGGVKVPEISPSDLKLHVFAALDSLDAGAIPNGEMRINSAYTKLYAIARPDTFVIFDSRVAAALTSIIDLHYQAVTNLPEWSNYEDLGFVNGRGGSRPRLLNNPWKNGYQKWSAQDAANRLCMDILKHVNSQPERYGLDKQLTLRELEAILFMEGY